MIVVIDNYDSFTYNLVHYIGEHEKDIQVIRNDEMSAKEVLNLNPKKIIISPGPCTPNEAGISIDLIKLSSAPLLGVCLGHQAIGAAFGALIFGTVSMGLLGLLSGDIEETTELQPLGTGRTFTANDFAGFVSFARSMTDKFSGGGTIKYVIQNIDKLSASGIAFDMGAIYKVGLFYDMTIGFSIKNFGGDMKYEGENLQQTIKLNDNVFEEDDVRIEVTSENYSLPISFDLGSSLTIPMRKSDQLIPSIAIHNIADQAEFLSFGLEYNFGELMYFILGHGNLNGMFDNKASEMELNGNMRGFTGGFGINLRPVFNTKSWISYSFEDHKYFAPIHSFEVTIEF